MCMCQFGSYFIPYILFLLQIFFARKSRAVLRNQGKSWLGMLLWGISNSSAKCQFFQQRTLILTSGVAAVSKRWCCLFCSLHNSYISKELRSSNLAPELFYLYFLMEETTARCIRLQKLGSWDLACRRLRMLFPTWGWRSSLFILFLNVKFYSLASKAVSWEYQRAEFLP